jgi:hypothetical protein
MDIASLADLLHEMEEHHGAYEAVAHRTTGGTGTPPISTRASAAARRNKPLPQPGST